MKLNRLNQGSFADYPQTRNSVVPFLMIFFMFRPKNPTRLDKWLFGLGNLGIVATVFILTAIGVAVALIVTAHH